MAPTARYGAQTLKVLSHRIQRGTARHGMARPSLLSHGNVPNALQCTAATPGTVARRTALRRTGSGAKERIIDSLSAMYSRQVFSGTRHKQDGKNVRFFLTG